MSKEGTNSNSVANIKPSPDGWHRPEIILNNAHHRVRSATNARTFLPVYNEEYIAGTPLRSYYPTTQSIRAKDFKYFFERDETANHIVEKVSTDIFTAWFEIKSKNESLINQIVSYNNKLDVKRKYRQSYKWMQIYGYSPMGLDWVDSAELTEIPEDIKDINKLRPYSPTLISKIWFERDLDSPDYGDIKSYDVFRNVEGTANTIRIPAERFLHFEREGVNDDGRGQSLYLSMFNALNDKVKMEWSLSEGYYKNVGTMAILKVPVDAPEAELDAAEEIWMDRNVKSEIMLPDNYSIEVVKPDISEQSIDVYDMILTRMGMSSNMGKNVLTGAAAGTMSTAKENRKEYELFIRSQQTEVIEYYLRKLYSKLQEHGIIDEGEYTIVWNPLFPEDAEGESKIRRNNSASLQLITRSLMNLETAGYELLTDDGFIYASKNDIAIKMPGLEGKLVSDLDTIKTSNTTNAVRLTKAERQEIYDTWGYEEFTPDIERRYENALQSSITKYQDTFLTWFEKQWLAEFQELNMEQFSRNETQEFIKTLTNFKGNSRQIQATIETYVDESYATSWNQTLELYGIDPSLIPFPTQAAADYVFQVGFPLTKDITNDLNQRALRQIMDGIRAGEGYAQINRRVQSEFAKYNKTSIPRTVQKTVHEAFMHVRMDIMEQQERVGPSGEIEVLWITAGDDRVRADHQDLAISSPIPISLARAHEGDFNCRCTVSPVSILRRIRDRGSVI